MNPVLDIFDFLNKLDFGEDSFVDWDLIEFWLFNL